MSKRREDYNKTIWKHLEDFVNGTYDEEIFEQGAELDAQEKTAKEYKQEETVEDYLIRQQKEDEQELMRRYDERVQKKGLHLLNRLYGIAALIICVTIMVTLLITVSYLPRFGQPDNPVNNEVPARYIEKGLQETGTVNIVTGMILNYRGFDTMGETHVLFIAASCVMILLMMTGKKEKEDAYINDRTFEPKNDLILQKAAAFLVPCIFIFGIYVILNGHLSPGGGFSGGAVIGAGLILYVSAFGFKKTQKFFNESVYKVAKISALCLYVLSLSYYFYTGANGIENHIPLGTPGAIVSSGLILFINIFVGTEVACTMYAFYALFRRGGL